MELLGTFDHVAMALGPPLSDVAYFLGGSLLPDDRRAHEEAIVRHYHERLQAAGGSISWDDCWTGYRRHAFSGLTMAVIASMLVVRTDRGDQMFIAMAERAARHAIDLETEALLTSASWWSCSARSTTWPWRSGAGCTCCPGGGT